MKWIYGFLIIAAFSRFQCYQEDVIECPAPGCGHLATVRDLTVLDGCGFVLELKDGSKLIPQKLTYVQAPDSLQDPGYYFNFVDGQKVCFDYRETEGVDACMAGPLVFLTCIRVCEDKPDN
jgi:hypothetical protein